MLKPEVFSSEQIAVAGELAFVQLQVLWVEGDDHGVHPASAYVLARRGISLWGHGADEVLRRIERLRSATDPKRHDEPLVYEYEADGTRYWLVPGFLRQNPNQRKPSFRYPLPPITDQSPAWLQSWGRENKEEITKFPGGVTVPPQSFPPEAEAEAEAEAGAEAGADPGTDSNTHTPSQAASRAREDAAGSAGLGKAQNQRPGIGSQTQQALDKVRNNLDARDAKITDLLGDDEAFALAVRKFGGWPDLTAAWKADPVAAGLRFQRLFGKACSKLRGKRAPPVVKTGQRRVG